MLVSGLPTAFSRREKCELLQHLPTLTEVLASSSDALLPPTLLDVLIRLLLLGAGRIMALSGRWGRVPGPGDDGGEAIVGKGKGGPDARSQWFCLAAQIKEANTPSEKCAADQARMRYVWAPLVACFLACSE